MKTERRVLVTGANGFIGRFLVEKLCSGSERVALMTRQPTGRRDVTEYVGDLRDADFVAASVAEWSPHCIFHLAAIRERAVQAEAVRLQIENNVVGSLNLFSAAQQLPRLQAVVALGTCEEYGNVAGPFVETLRELPISAYSFSKQCVTKLCEMAYGSWGLPVAVVRPTMAYGPGQPPDMFLPALIRSLLADKPFPMTAGEQTRDYVFVSDLVDALLIIAETPAAMGKVLNVGTEEKVRLVDLAQLVERLTGKRGLLRVGEVAYRTQDIMDYSVDCSLLRSLVDWKPQILLEAGLRKTIEWYRLGVGRQREAEK